MKPTDLQTQFDFDKEAREQAERVKHTKLEKDYSYFDSCRETMDELHRYGQKMAMERMGWTKEDFMREFGRNYLNEEDLQPTEEKPTGTFQILDEELCMNW